MDGEGEENLPEKLSVLTDLFPKTLKENQMLPDTQNIKNQFQFVM